MLENQPKFNILEVALTLRNLMVQNETPSFHSYPHILTKCLSKERQFSNSCSVFVSGHRILRKCPWFPKYPRFPSGIMETQKVHYLQIIIHCRIHCPGQRKFDVISVKAHWITVCSIFSKRVNPWSLFQVLSSTPTSP